MLGESEIAHMEALGVQKCSRRCLLTPRRTAPCKRLGFSVEGQGPGASPPHQQVVRRWPSGRQEWGCDRSGPPGLAGGQRGLPRRRGGIGAQVPCSGLVARRQGIAPRLGPHSHHSSQQATVAERDPRSSAKDPLLGAGAFVPLTNPLHHAGQREGKPAPGARILEAPQSHSSLNDSQSGSSTRG